MCVCVLLLLLMLLLLVPLSPLLRMTCPIGCRYEEECKDLLSKIKTLRNVCASVTDLDRFVAEHRVSCEKERVREVA